MFISTDYQAGNIDLVLDFYGYEDCPTSYSFGPAIRDNFVLHYISKGRGKFHYKERVVELEAGDLFLLKPNELTYYEADKKEPWSYYWLGISGAKSSDYFRLSEIFQTAFLKPDKKEQTERLGEWIERIVEEAEQSQTSHLYHLHILGQVYELLFQLGQIAPMKAPHKKKASYQLYLDTKHIIETRYPLEQLTIQGIAQELNVHRSYLTMIFKEHQKLSPKEFLLYVRMQRAKQLLENTQQPIKFIAYSVGFSDPLYFSKAFKQFFHFSPSQFRKAN